MSESDDFAAGVLDPVWTIGGPAGTSAGLGTSATDGYLDLVTPDGNHDVWDANNGARAMQATDDTDFQIETRFLSTPTEKFQIQGMLVEQDANNWIRFDTYSNGSKLFAFAGITVDGVSTTAIKVRIPGGEAPYLRVTRAGDDWTLEYSTDGATWVTAGSFTHALTVSSTGVFAGNTGPATGFTAQVDYFENTADPILDEDGTITPVNNAPDAFDDALATDEDVALVINVAADLLANDSDPDGDPFNLTGVTQPTNGSLVDNGDGTYTYTPDAGFSGSDSFTYTISDGSLTDTATVNLTVNDTTPSNDPPVALNDALATDEDVALVINVAANLLANDSDPDGDPFNLTGVTQPTNGSLVDNGDGTYTYTPDAGFSGSDSFTYTISDGSLTDTATVNLTVGTPPPGTLVSDDFAAGVLDPVWTIGGPAGTSAGLGTSATDGYLDLVTPDGNHDVWDANNGARAMQATDDTDFQIETRFLSTPTEKFQIQGMLVEQDANNWIRFDTYSNGSKLFAFAGITVDGVSTTAIKVRIPGGEAPYLRVTRAGDDWTLEYSTDGATWVTAGSFTHALTVSSTGVFAGNTGPATGFTAQVDYFENTADPILDEDGTITPVNNAPDAFDDALATDEDVALVINVAADLLANDSDPDGDPFNLTGVTQPTNGSLVDNGDGTYTYTPDAGFSGSDSFTYTISDGSLTDTATVNLTVNDTTPSNDPPVALNDALATDEDVALVINVAANLLANDSDPDGDPFNLTGVTQPTNGSLVDNGDGTYTYTPDAGFSGSDSFTYTISDGSLTDTATVNLTVGTPPPGNTPPVIATGTSQFSKTTVSTAMPLTHIALAADFDGDGDLDIVATSEQNDSVVWFENDGALNFTAHNIDTVLESAYPASLADLDQDGDMDVLAGGYRDDEYVWYENDGNGNFTKHVIANQNGAHSIFAVDMDGDGDLDLATAGQEANVISWYENDGNQNFSEHVVDTASMAAKSSVPVDLDGDGDIDFVTASFDDDTFAWYENDGSQNFTKHVIDAGADGAYFATTADIDGDGYIDIVTASKNDDSIAWYRNDGNQNFTKILISADADAARYVSTADIDGDGDIDVLSASVDDNTIRLFVNDGSGGFTTIIVDDAAIGAYGATPVDMNGDGLLDVLGASKTDGTVSVLTQEKAHAVTLPPGDSLSIDSALLSASDAEQGPSSLVYTLNITPTMGEIRLDGTPLGLGGSFTQEDIDLGRVSYHQTGTVEGSDSFTLGLSDGISPAAAVVFDLSLTTPPAPSDLSSDDFAAGTLDPAWTIEGPSGISSGFGSDATDAWLELVTPDGNHDVWHVNNGARAMQTTADTNFQVETRFLSTPSVKYQLQGLVIEEDADNWLRFDTYSDGNNLYAFAAITTNGNSSSVFKVTIPGGSAPYLRLTRDGDDWTYEYSGDGTAWVTAGSFTHAMTVTAAGVFAGNTAGATGFTAIVDYFENTADPIADEDGNIVVVNQAPDAGDDALVTPVDVALLIDTASDLLANDSDPNGDPFSLTGFTQPTNGTLVDNGDGSFTYTPNAGFSGSDNFTYTINDGDLSDTANVTVAVGNPIDVWYGLNQSFGDPGEGQERINILGNVSGNVTALTYSINGGPEQTLSIGADGIRLQNPGDFNADIFYSDLNGSATDDIVTITATLAGGAVVSRDVVIDYEAGNVWNPNTTIDWSTVTDIQDVVQVVDGTWSWDSNGVRPIDTGYDRLLVLGDQGWDNFQLNTVITMHDIHTVDPIKGGGFAIGMLWNGHTDSRYGDIQPLSGWEPGAAFMYRNDRIKSHSYDDWSDVLGQTSPLNLQEGLSYNFTVQVEQTGVYDRVYSIKLWEVGTSEPVGWTLQTTETFTLAEAPATGSIYLNSHFYDVAFGDITVTEIVGNDIIQGTDSDDILSAVDIGSGTPGQGEVDVFNGKAGADVFIFGDSNGAYYDDGNGADTGEADYGFVWDFTSGEDQVQLAGSAADYILTTDAPGLSPGTAIWLIGQNGDQDELIGVLHGTYGLDLYGSEFIFIDTLLT